MLDGQNGFISIKTADISDKHEKYPQVVGVLRMCYGGDILLWRGHLSKQEAKTDFRNVLSTF